MTKSIKKKGLNRIQALIPIDESKISPNPIELSKIQNNKNTITKKKKNKTAEIK